MAEKADLRTGTYRRISATVDGGKVPNLFRGPGVMCMHGVLKRIFQLVPVFFCVAAVALAQSGELSLRGQVTDQSGAIVPHIPVTLIGPEGVTRVAATEESD